VSETPCLAANATARQAKPLRAARANRVFCTDKKRIRTENAVMQLLRNNCHIRANVFVILVAANGRAKGKTRTVRGFHTRSWIACGCAFHPRAIDDPRGRILVRATLQLRNNPGTN